MSSSQQTVISIETTRRVVHIGGLGECRVRGASMALEERLAANCERPLQVSYRHFVNELVAGCVEHPALTACDVDALRAGRRQRLVRAVVASECDLDQDLRRLRGSCLGPDERVFAAKMWAYQRWMARMAEMVVGFGIAASTELKKLGDAIRPHIREFSDRLGSLFPQPRTSLLVKAGLGGSLAHIAMADFRRRSSLAGLGAQLQDQLKVRGSVAHALNLDGIVRPHTSRFATASLASQRTHSTLTSRGARTSSHRRRATSSTRCRRRRCS
jgi:hypothetical protein